MQRVASSWYGAVIAPVGQAPDAAVGVPHDHRVQAHVGGGLGPADTLPQVELHRVALEPGLVGSVDEVAPPGRPVGAERGDDLVDRLLDPVQPEAGGAEEPHHPGLRHGDGDPRRVDTVRHRAGHVGEAQPVDLDVAGRSKLTLEVDFGPHFDVGDHVVWGDAQLVRPATLSAP